jgi:hypothetical protein
MTVEVGSVAAWVGSIFSGGALVVAFVGWNAEREARRRDLARLRRSQARLVTIALDLSSQYAPTGSSRGPAVKIVTIRNLSEEPISDIDVIVEIDAHSARSSRIEVLLPVLAGLSDHVWHLTFDVGVVNRTGQPLPHQTWATMHYTDASGTRWTRTDLGHLEPARLDPPRVR